MPKEVTVTEEIVILVADCCYCKIVGNTRQQTELLTVQPHGGGYHYVKCLVCDLSGPTKKEIKGAVLAWNGLNNRQEIPLDGKSSIFDPID